MTRIAVYALGADRLVVCGDAGERWVLDVGAERLGEPAVVQVLDGLRASGPDAVSPVCGEHDAIVGSLADVVELGARDADAGASVVVWRYGSRHVRMLLDGRGRHRNALDARDALLSTVDDAEMARAFARHPLVDDVVLARTGRLDAPTPGVLQCADDGGWGDHAIDPAPLVDALTGILHRVRKRPVDLALPPGFEHWHAELPFLSSIDARWLPDPLAPAGAFIGAVESGREAAIRSGVAHYCGAYLGQGARVYASEAELAGERVLTIAQWRPHDPVLDREPGFPFAPVAPDERLWWLRGSDDDGPCVTPLSLVHAGYLQAALPGMRATNGHNLGGLQAGASLAEAVERACAHVVAHDAVARWWDSGDALGEVPVPSVVADAWGGSDLALRVLAVPAVGGLPVRLAVVDDGHANIVSLGFAGHADADEAGVLAVVEALIQHASARDLDRPDSLIRDAGKLGNGGVAGLREHSPARDYADAFGDDHRGLIDPMAHVQFGLDPRVVAETRRRVVGAGVPAGSTSAAAATSAATSARRALRDTGHRVVTVDVTTDRVRRAGMHAARVLVPGLARLQPAAFPLTVGGGTPYPGW
ncbi:YcaO-like family protein [Agromyces atrinae]|uniref:Ribosomal protein S12 methylthiotransferase accessory factor n=1 Tax=Agromyces atrinae TaxID=592376 RepID=A0A4Q2M8I1_9MICO|nr:YcaO-like family protein [Agromyces atrinae]NYD68193.1 ribosomal protein S12 methylthiotransferase accessory factor [Agromyces atrinae]RXZ87667.1 hypothetical protein ESP50_00210 [Agromyces atrinae]